MKTEISKKKKNEFRPRNTNDTDVVELHCKRGVLLQVKLVSTVKKQSKV
jgi:hypothetical protein